ncbi:MAG TPA: hypothetical protein VMI11_07540, partial [Actinomycetes bacterium]|nr:hypothetical protein [Actinomycetes bacterium]
MKLKLLVVALALAVSPACALHGVPVTPVVDCKLLGELRQAACPAGQEASQACVAAQDALAAAGCSVKPSCPASCPAGHECVDPGQGCVAVTPPATCPASCPAGQACSDPAKGCVAVPPVQTGCSLDGHPGPGLANFKATLGEQVNKAIQAVHPECA